MTSARSSKRKDFYVVPFAVDIQGQHEHRLYCHYKRRAVENYGKPITESMQDISIATGMGVSTISRARKVLALAGWITVVPGRPDKVTVHETITNVPIGNADVPIGNAKAAENTIDVPQATTNVPIGNNSTFPWNELRDARVIEIEKEKRISPTEIATDVAHSVPQSHKSKPPKKPKVDKPSSPLSESGKAVNALIAAWKKATGSMRGNPFKNSTYRECAENMAAAGIVPDQVTAFVEDQTQPGMYWHGKSMPFTITAEHIAAWLKVRKPAPELFSPEDDPQANLHTPQGDDEDMTPEKRKAMLADIRKLHAEMASRTFEQQIEYWQQTNKPGAS